MILDPKQLSARQKVILSGLYLAKYNIAGLHQLGFASFREAYNVLGFALGASPASIKNYRDEFDPFFPHRNGWHKRPRRQYCLDIMEIYQDLPFAMFSAFIRSFFGAGEPLGESTHDCKDEAVSAFAKRLITGMAAERYFEKAFPDIIEFSGYSVQDTTLLGCGYDFQLIRQSDPDFLAVEVKGMSGCKGKVSLTEKEHGLALSLGKRFFLLVVKNFAESPFHEIYCNPLSGPLCFRSEKQIIVKRNWSSTI